MYEQSKPISDLHFTKCYSSVLTEGEYLEKHCYWKYKCCSVSDLRIVSPSSLKFCVL